MTSTAHWRFNDALFDAVGVSRLWAHGNMAAWGRSRAEPAFCIATQFDQGTATPGNGAMIALRMVHRDDAARMHAKALELGGSCEGAPGPRGEHGVFAAYFRDLDGNKLNAYVPGP